MCNILESARLKRAGKVHRIHRCFYSAPLQDRLSGVAMEQRSRRATDDAPPASQIVPTHSRPTSLGFSSAEEPTPAVLLRILLLRAGIEANPGPPRLRWPCTSCQKSAATDSVQCSQCKRWVHLSYKCSNLRRLSDYDYATFVCPACLSAAPQPNVA